MTTTTFVIFFFVIAIIGIVQYALGGDEKPRKQSTTDRESFIPTAGSLEDFMDPTSPRQLWDPCHPSYSNYMHEDD